RELEEWKIRIGKSSRLVRAHPKNSREWPGGAKWSAEHGAHAIGRAVRAPVVVAAEIVQDDRVAGAGNPARERRPIADLRIVLAGRTDAGARHEAFTLPVRQQDSGGVDAEHRFDRADDALKDLIEAPALQARLQDRLNVPKADRRIDGVDPGANLREPRVMSAEDDGDV